MADKKVQLPKKRIRRWLRAPLFWIIIAIVVISVFGRISNSGNQFIKVDTSTVLAEISANKVDSALLVDKDQKIQVILKSGVYVNGSQKLEANYVANQEPLIVTLLTSNPPPKAWNVKIPTTSFLATLLYSFGPFLLIGFLLMLFMGNANGGNKVFQFGRSKAKLNNKENPTNTFADVAGADEAVQELREIKQGT